MVCPNAFLLDLHFVFDYNICSGQASADQPCRQILQEASSGNDGQEAWWLVLQFNSMYLLVHWHANEITAITFNASSGTVFVVTFVLANFISFTGVQGGWIVGWAHLLKDTASGAPPHQLCTYKGTSLTAEGNSTREVFPNFKVQLAHCCNCTWFILQTPPMFLCPIGKRFQGDIHHHWW